MYIHFIDYSANDLFQNIIQSKIKHILFVVFICTRLFVNRQLPYWHEHYSIWDNLPGISLVNFL